MDCLDANVVQDLMANALAPAQRDQVLAHLDGCAECRELLGVTARDSTRPPPKGVAGSPRRDVSLDDTVAPTAPAAPTAPTAAGAALDETVDVPREARPTDETADVGRPPKIRPPRSSTMPGGTLGRYELVERLGAGAMGVVWRAEDPKLGRHVALKLLKRDDAELTERLVREAQAMAKVNHPNVVAVYEVDVHGGSTFIAMELVEGTSLRAWQSATRRKIPEIIEAYIAAGRGLAAAHAAGIVHRDFKPDNVLVGTDGRVRVTDFGLASAKHPESASGVHDIGDVNLTTQGSMLGTPSYMAPEQFAGGNVDSRTDQFNFCVALYEALYGERPFEGRTFPELSDNVTAGKVKAAPAGTAVSGELRAIVLRGLSVKPGDRFPAMEHLLVELGRDRARPWRRTAIAVAAVAAALLVGLGADWAVRDRTAAQIREAFRATGTQVERAGVQRAQLFQTASQMVGLYPSMDQVTAYRDQADFGLATPEQDAEHLQQIHDTLFSQDWALVRSLGGEHASHAVADYKGRLLYTSAAPTEWKSDLGAVPAIKRAIDAGRGDFAFVVRYDDQAFAAARLFGPTPGPGLALMFAHVLDHGGERAGVFLQFVDGREVLDGIKLDDTLLGLVAPDGTTIGDVPAALAAAAPPNGDVASLERGATTFNVQARTLSDFSGQPFARVVMARELRGVLSLFPGARLVFAVAAALAAALALFAAARARRITGARV